MQTESVSRKDILIGLEVLLGIMLLMIVTVFLLMRPKPATVPNVIVEPTDVALPTITPLPTMTPFPTFTPSPTQTPGPTLPPASADLAVVEVVATTETVTTSTPSGSITYTVQAGETLLGIASKFGVPMEDLQVLNDLDGETIYYKQILIIPDGGEGVAALSALLSAPEAEERIHIVQAGDTLGGIASLYDVTIEAIMIANGMTSDVIQLDQELIIPGN